MSEISDKLRAAQLEMDDDDESYIIAGLLAGIEEHNEGKCGGAENWCLLCKADELEPPPSRPSEGGG